MRFIATLTALSLVSCTDNRDCTTVLPTAVTCVLPPSFPEVVRLPNGFSPEGMTFGKGTTLYAGSLNTGAIYRVDARTGIGAVLVAAHVGGSANGLRYDPIGDYLFVAGGQTGQAFVYDATTGGLLATYQLADAATVDGGLTLVNDVVILNDAVYFTDSFQPVLYKLPLGKKRELPAANAVVALQLRGDYSFVPGGFAGGFNGTGIAATGANSLILLNSDAGELFRVDPNTGVTKRIELSGASIATGDGILLADHRLYVVLGAPNEISTVSLSPDFSSGVVGSSITNSHFADPTAIAALGSSLYVLNGRFDVAPPGVPSPDVEFQVIRVPR